MKVKSLKIAGSGLKGRGSGILLHDGQEIPFRLSGGASLSATHREPGQHLPGGAEKVILQAHHEEQLRRVEASYRAGGWRKVEGRWLPR